MKKEYEVPSFERYSFKAEEEVTAGEANGSVTFGDDLDEW